MRQQPQSIIAATMSEFGKAWCVVEYMINDGQGGPPEPMLITAVRLVDAYTFAEASRNSEWRKYVTPDHGVIVQIHVIGTRQECVTEANKMIMHRNPRPRGNVYGYNSFSLARKIQCSNGQVYENQAEAARLLDVNQGAISRNLSGGLKQVKGYIFTYVE